MNTTTSSTRRNVILGAVGIAAVAAVAGTAIVWSDSDDDNQNAAPADTTETTDAEVVDFDREIVDAECDRETLVAANARCATLDVPIDWSDPGSDDVTLSLAVKPAANQQERLGTLFLNNGSGGSAIEQLHLALQTGAIDGTVLTDRYDLVAIDPRGVGRSAGIDCGRPIRSDGITLRPTTQAEFDDLVADSVAFAEACRAENGDLVDHLDNESNARDFDAVRQALGEDTIVFYGIERSTLDAYAYAELFPEQLDKIVLDTVLDDTQAPSRYVADQADALETGLAHFAAWCDESDECALTGQDVIEVFDTVVADANETPIPTDDGVALSGYDISRATQEQLVNTLAWPFFSGNLAAAAAGDASGLTVTPDGTLDFVQDHVLRCAQTPAASDTFDDLTGLAAMVDQIAPHTRGATRAWDTAAGCIGWPNRPDVASAEVNENAPATFIAQSTNNTLSNYPTAFNVAERFPDSSVVTGVGDDYSLVAFSPCVAEAFAAFAETDELPANGTICDS